MALLSLLQQYAHERIHIVGALDHTVYKIISIQLYPYELRKYTQLQVSLHKQGDEHGDCVKREDLPFQEGQLVWHKALEYTKWMSEDENTQASWVDAISEIIKIYIKRDGEWDTIPWVGKECVVCYRSWGVNTSLPCGHLFCKKCILKWAEHSNTCPCCRRTFEVKFIGLGSELSKFDSVI